MPNETQLSTEIEGVKIPAVIQGNRQKAEAYAAGCLYFLNNHNRDKVPASLRDYVPPKGARLGSETVQEMPFYSAFEGGYLEAQARGARRSSKRSAGTSGRGAGGDDDLVTKMHRARTGLARYFPEGLSQTD